MDPMSDSSDLGGDPACWVHLFDEDGREIEEPERTASASPVTEPARDVESEDDPVHGSSGPDRD